MLGLKSLNKNIFSKILLNRTSHLALEIVCCFTVISVLSENERKMLQLEDALAISIKWEVNKIVNTNYSHRSKFANTNYSKASDYASDYASYLVSISPYTL